MQLLGNVAQASEVNHHRGPHAPQAHHQERGPCPSSRTEPIGAFDTDEPEQLIGRAQFPIKAKLEDGRHRNQRKHRRDEDS